MTRRKVKRLRRPDGRGKDKAMDVEEQMDIATASPAQLIHLMYDEAIGALSKTVDAVEAGDIEGRWRANGKAMSIIAELACSLNLDKGGQIARNLYQLYEFLLRTLPLVDIRNDAKPAKDALGILGSLRESWRELAARDTAELARAKAQALWQTENRRTTPEEPAVPQTPVKVPA